MKSESLHALVIDQHSGELPPEMADLLEAYLASHPAAREESARILKALQLTSETVARYPDCVRAFIHEEINPVREARRRWSPPMWMQAAAVVAISALTAAGGFYAGSARSGAAAASTVMASAVPVMPRKDSPWARYRMALDPLGGGMQVVRVDLTEKEARP